CKTLNETRGGFRGGASRVSAYWHNMCHIPIPLRSVGREFSTRILNRIQRSVVSAAGGRRSPSAQLLLNAPWPLGLLRSFFKNLPDLSAVASRVANKWPFRSSGGRVHVHWSMSALILKHNFILHLVFRTPDRSSSA